MSKQHSETVTPTLARQQTEQSSVYDDEEKLNYEHREVSQAPKLDTFAEEDENNVGAHAYEQSKLMAEITPKQNKFVVRRIDWFILPLFLITQTIQYLDKTALNYAKVFGMEKAMHLKGQEFSLAASIFYIGYMCAQMPSAYLIGRYPAGKVLGVFTVIWGVSVFTMVANKSFAHIMVNRFFLGALEAPVTPGLSLMTGFWYTRAEQPLRQTIWYSSVGWGGMIGSLMAAAITKMPEGPVEKWKMIFYILGAITVAWGFVLYFFLADGPSNAFWLKADMRPLAVARVANNGTGIKSKAFDRKQAVAALKDPKAWLLTIAMFGSSVPNGVLTNFSGTIIRGLGFSIFNAALLDCAGRSLQVISLLIAGIVATKVENMRVIVVTAGNIICVMGSAMMAFLPAKMIWGRLIGFWLINCQSVGFTLGLVMIASNIGGYTKRSVTSSMVFAAYCVGNIVGPLTVFPNEAPRYKSAGLAMVVSYGAKTIAHAALGVYMYMSNKSRDKKYGPADPKLAADAGMRGETEDENIHFRYVL